MRRALPAAIAVLALLAAPACTKEPELSPEEAAERVESVDVPPPAGTSSTLREGFASPESAVYDPEQDVYFVSNIDGAPTAADDNGYISRVDAATGEVEPRWISGTSTEVTLHGPRGLSLQGDRLYAVDVGSLRWFDRRTGEPLGEVAIPEGLFLNDAFAAADGSVYVSDSGLPGTTEPPPPGPMDAVFRVRPDDGTFEEVARGQELHRPDGLWVHEGALWVTAFDSREVYRLVDGAKNDVQTLPAGALDGLIWLDDNTFLVSSWDGDGIYRGRPGGPYELVVRDVDAPADFGLDTRRRLLIVPHLTDHVVSLHPLSGEAAE